MSPRRQLLAGLWASLASATLAPARAQTPGTKPPAICNCQTRPSYCLVATYAGFSGSTSNAQFEEALIASLRALAKERQAVNTDEDDARIARHLNALRELLAGVRNQP